MRSIVNDIWLCMLDSCRTNSSWTWCVKFMLWVYDRPNISWEFSDKSYLHLHMSFYSSSRGFIGVITTLNGEEKLTVLAMMNFPSDDEQNYTIFFECFKKHYPNLLSVNKSLFLEMMTKGCRLLFHNSFQMDLSCCVNFAFSRMFRKTSMNWFGCSWN